MSNLPTYSNAQEDLLLLFLFEYKNKGCYLDLGSHEPDKGSNTFLLYQLGWRGTDIVLHQAQMEKLQTQRSQDKIYSMVEWNPEPDSSYPSPLTSQEIDLINIQTPELALSFLQNYNWENHAPHLVLVEYKADSKDKARVQELMNLKGYQSLFINRWSILFTRHFEQDWNKLYADQTEGALLPPFKKKIHPHIPIQKTLEAWQKNGYLSNPELSFIIQSHNRSEAVIDLVKKLRPVDNTEIIVIDDGSQPHHFEALAEFLTQGNQFLIRANDLYEVITYDRAISLARGKWVVLLQDDDSFKDLDWLKRGIAICNEVKDLAILGGNTAITPLPIESTPDGKIGEYTFTNNIANTPNLCRELIKIDDDYPNGFQFMPVVVRGPMWINRDLFLTHLQHLDQSYAPFLADDYDLCFRAWRCGLKVGWYPSLFDVEAYGTGGMRLWNKDLNRTQNINNFRRFYKEHGDHLEEVAHMAKSANEELHHR